MTKLVALVTAALLGTLPSTTPRTDLTASGAVYTFDFRTPSSGDIKVFVDPEDDGTYVPVTTGFAVALTPKGANDTMYPGGTVTFTVAPASGKVRIERTVAVTQDSLWTPYGAFKAKTLEGVLDRLVMQDQQLDRKDGDLAAKDAALGTKDSALQAEIDAEEAARAAADAAATNDRAAIRGEFAAGDGATRTYVESVITGAYAGTGVVPAEWTATGNGTTVRFATPGSTLFSPSMYLVTLSGVVQRAGADYTVDLGTHEVVFTTPPANGVPISVRSTGYSLGVNEGDNSLVTATGSTTARALKDWLSAKEVVRPSGDTSGATDVAAINAATAAGKAVQLTAGVYYVNAPLNLGNGSTGVGYFIHGVPWTIDAAWDQILSGTEIRAVGSTAIMQYAPTTYVAHPTTYEQIQNQALKGVDVQDIAFRGGTYAIRVGTTYNTGVMWGTFKNLMARDWTGWAFWFENCAYNMFEKLYAIHGAPGAAGNMMFAASQPIYNHGNNTHIRLFSQNSYPMQRGTVFKAYTGTVSSKVYFNDINAFDVQNNQSGVNTTATATSAGAADLTLSAYGAGASIASFPVDMPITVATTSLGLTQWQSYYVISNNGTNTIQVSDMQGGAAKTVSAGSVGILTNGFPSIEIVGYGYPAYSQVTGSTFHGIDAEGTASNEVFVQSANVDLSMTYAEYEQGTTAGHVFSALAARRSYGTARSTMRLTTDFDSSSKRLILSGAEIATDAYPTTAAVQNRPPGLSFDAGLGVVALTLDGFSPYGISLHPQNTDTSSFIYPAQPIGQRASYSTQLSRQLSSASGGGTVAYVGSSATTWTLPRLRAGVAGQGSVAASAGETYDIANANAGGYVLTVNTWSATNGANTYNGNTGATDDRFMRNAGKTSYSCPDGASLSVRANYDGTKAFWQVISNNGCT
jgi:hypothetical protein